MVFTMTVGHHFLPILLELLQVKYGIPKSVLSKGILSA